MEYYRFQILLIHKFEYIRSDFRGKIFDDIFCFLSFTIYKMLNLR